MCFIRSPATGQDVPCVHFSSRRVALLMRPKNVLDLLCILLSLFPLGRKKYGVSHDMGVRNVHASTCVCWMFGDSSSVKDDGQAHT